MFCLRTTHGNISQSAVQLVQIREICCGSMYSGFHLAHSCFLKPCCIQSRQPSSNKRSSSSAAVHQQRAPHNIIRPGETLFSTPPRFLVNYTPKGNVLYIRFKCTFCIMNTCFFLFRPRIVCRALGCRALRERWTLLVFSRHSPGTAVTCRGIPQRSPRHATTLRGMPRQTTTFTTACRGTTTGTRPMASSTA